MEFLENRDIIVAGEEIRIESLLLAETRKGKARISSYSTTLSPNTEGKEIERSDVLE
ncbi:hypothetical protein IPA_02195 [Ignicoccus pacificus DSM 13166]|uniref:Uncharacterized protein n=1 Tax=Ignicoccus pacificus DSM 13166 TaxID=940294 RepID=A0A977PKN2_9CREN|nr:hypothetical protein IPA_02195 [Ignicoccus pacificus DSM 13166]